MSAVVSIPLRLATNAVRRTAGLRAETGNLRAAARSAAALRTLRVEFPAEVLGGELFAMMSAQFRGLLGQSAAAEPAGTASGARSEFPEGRREAVPGRVPEEARAKPPNLFAFPAAHAGQKGSRANEAIRSRADARGVTVRESATISAPAQAGSPASSAGVPEEGEWPATVSATKAAGLQPPAAPSGILVRQLREYWDTERKSVVGRNGGASVVTGAAPKREAGAQATEEIPPPGPSFRAAPITAAQRLQAFVSGQNGVPVDFARRPWEVDEGKQGKARLPGETSLASPTGAHDFEFADRLATILRRQALHHGIDVT